MKRLLYAFHQVNNRISYRGKVYVLDKKRYRIQKIISGLFELIGLFSVWGFVFYKGFRHQLLIGLGMVIIVLLLSFVVRSFSYQPILKHLKTTRCLMMTSIKIL